MPALLRALDRPASDEARLPWTPLLLAGSALALAAAATLAPPAAAASPADAELARLLRAMAALKGVMLALALAALGWRFRRPVQPGVASGYVVAAWAAAAALGAVWQQAAPALTAVVLHGAGAALLVLASRDRDFFPGSGKA